MTDQTFDNCVAGDVSINPIKIQAVGQMQLEHLVERLIRERRERENYFRGELFADPAWDILLVLFLAEIQQQRISISKVCDSVGVPPTTALRWITSLAEDGLLTRRDDPMDGRRTFLELAPEASAAMCSYCWATAAALRLAA